MAEVGADSGLAWRRLSKWAVIAGVVEYIVVMATAKAVIPPLVVISIVLLVGLALSGRPGRAGVIVTLVGFVLFFVSNLLFAGVNFTAPTSFPSWALILAATVTGLVGIASGIATLRDSTAAAAPLAMARVAAALIVLAVAGNLIASLTYSDASAQAGDVAVTAKDTKFAPDTLAASAGSVTFFFDNKDILLHNFHIKGVGSAVLLPAGHQVRHSFDLQPGTYEYVCDLHTDMKGTLTVS